ncbi:MAG: hypothetical protein J6U93_08395 [Alistipes sp.]|nr:hypothetical protein [Alistipes sp.]
MKRLFQLFAIATLALGFTACENPSENTNNGEIAISLTADKSEIVANGVDKVTFTATVNGEANDKIQIINLKNNSFVENNTFTTLVAGDYLFKAVYENKSSEAFKVTATEPTEPLLLLSADKQSIVADGEEVVTFTVTLNGEDVTANSTITNIVTNLTLEGNTFATDAIGEYLFEAKYESYTSPQVSINATAIPQKSLTLKASKMRIKADGEEKVIFTALYGEDDVTASCTLHTTTGSEIEGAEFATTTPGTYNIYALYNNTRSNTISIDAYDPAIAGQYEIGQIYEVSGSKGMIYAIKGDASGNTWVYLCSLDEADLQWSTENVMCNCISSKGAWNTYDPFDPTYSKADGGVRDINNYPAFKWCMEHGDDWFLPSSQELQWMWDAISEGTHNFNNASVAKYNKILTDNGGMPFIETYYWSSNETAADSVELIAFMEDSIVCLEPYKTKVYTVRAAYRFQI